MLIVYCQDNSDLNLIDIVKSIQINYLLPLQSRILGSYAVIFDSNYNLSISPNGEALSIGYATTETSAAPFDRAFDDIDVLRRAQGAFSYIKFQDGKIHLLRSLTGPYDLFYGKINGSAFISDSIEALAYVHSPLLDEIDADYCIDYITGNFGHGGGTPFSHVKEVCLGELVLTDLNRYWRHSFHNAPFRSRDTLIESIYSAIRHYSNNDRPITLLASGGLDSSALMYIMHSNSIKFKAVHIEYSRHNEDSEAPFARLAAETIGCDIELARWNKNITFPFSKDRKTTIKQAESDAISERILDKVFDARNCVLTGHGGDHVFVQSPGINVPVDQLIKGRFISSARDAARISKLRQFNFYRLLIRSIAVLTGITPPRSQALPEWLLKNSSPDRDGKREHYMLKGIDKRTAKYLHISNILSGSKDNGDLFHPEKRYCAPLVLQGVIGHVVDMPIGKMFSARYDRILLREALWEQSKMDIFWRRSKGGSDRQLMEEFSNAEEEIMSSIEDGSMRRLDFIDVDAARRQLAYSARIGPIGDISSLFRLISLEAELSKIKQFILAASGNAHVGSGDFAPTDHGAQAATARTCSPT